VPHDALLLARLHGQEGAFPAAAARLRGLVAEGRGRPDPTLLWYALAGFAGLAAAWGDHRAAARLFGAAMGAEMDRAGAVRRGDGTLHALSRDMAAVRRALGDGAFETARAEGQRMTPDEAAGYALGLEPPARAPAPTSASPLSPREREVAALIAGGNSNREIAEALVVAEATAERHVANILNKLGFHSRAQVAAWQVQQDAGV
jgi:DNA-binding CsgD family transcriptional regulator